MRYAFEVIDRLAQQIIEDDALTEGLSEEDASELVSWLIDIAEDFSGEPGVLRERYMGQLKRLGREVARLSRKHHIPVESLIDLIELAWEEPEGGSDNRPMQA